MSDSPIWKRGNRSRSNRVTRTPCWASRVETVLPAGPPPITTTSVDLSSMRIPRGSFPTAGGMFVRLSGGVEQGGQLAELSQVAAAQRVTQLAEQGGAGRRDSHIDHAAICGRPVAHDQAALGELVE